MLRPAATLRALSLFLALGTFLPLFAEITLPPLFADHMVLQRSASTPVWGRSTPGATISVALGSRTVSAVADATGRWRADLDLSGATEGPYELVISGDGRVALSDVLVGEVWLASGQSNMARTLRAPQDEEALSTPANDRIRFFTVERVPLPDAPTSEFGGAWTIDDSATRLGFSAVGYYFASRVQSELGVPVAILHSSWAGTNIDSWIGVDAQKTVPLIESAVSPKLKSHAEFPAIKTRWLSSARDWFSAHDRDYAPPDAATVAAFAVAPAKAGEDGWTSVKLPGALPGDRVVWLRREISISSKQAGKPLLVHLDKIEGIDTLYWDGQPFAGRTLDDFNGDGYSRLDTDRRYTLPAELATAGKHTLAIRLYVPLPWEKPAVGRRTLAVAGNSVTGVWLTKTERAFPALSANDRAAAPRPLDAPLRHFNVPGSLYNGMIHPLAPYGLRGVLWYQGENDAGNTRTASVYAASFPLMIAEWRKLWGRDDLAFFWCQLPSYLEKSTKPDAPAGWAELREAQASALRLPRTGQAVLLDAGEVGDVHPRDKRPPGARLAALALGIEYGRDTAYSGPEYKSASVEGSSIRVHFDHVGSGLVARPLPADYVYQSGPKPDMRPLVPNRPDSALEGFAIRGADGVWRWADARIDGDTVLVSSPEIAAPVAVRYAWANSPTFNLYNADGFPAAPFRSND